MKIRISDIAERIQVSTATVSLALNEKPGVSQEMREKILAIAKEMNYQGKMGGSRCKSINFLKIAKTNNSIESPNSVFIDDLIEGISTEARSHGYTMNMTYLSRFSIETISTHADCEGFIILGTDIFPEDLEVINKIEKPVVLLDSNIPVVKRDQIGLDNTHAVYEILSHLIKYGHSRIGLVKGSKRAADCIERYQAFIQAMNYFNLDIQENFIISLDETNNNIVSQFEKFKICKPTALICLDDTIALKTYQALILMGFRIPEEISLSGIDYLPVRRFIHPPLTTFRYPFKEMGHLAFRLLKSRAEKDHISPFIKYKVQGELVSQQTVFSLKNNL